MQLKVTEPDGNVRDATQAEVEAFVGLVGLDRAREMGLLPECAKEKCDDEMRCLKEGGCRAKALQEVATATEAVASRKPAKRHRGRN